MCIFLCGFAYSFLWENFFHSNAGSLLLQFLLWVVNFEVCVVPKRISRRDEQYFHLETPKKINQIYMFWAAMTADLKGGFWGM